MNIYGGRGRNSQTGCFESYEIAFVIVVFFSLWSEVHTLKMEWSFVSPYQLMQQNRNWYPLQGGDRADVDFSNGGSIAFVPASHYGLYNRGYIPREINIHLSKPHHDEDRHGKHHDYDHEPSEHRPSDHNRHHETPREQLNNEHAEQAELSGAMADGLRQLIEAKKTQMHKHMELRDDERSRGNEEAAKMEQALVNILKQQIEYLEGVEKAEEAIMAGEIEMYHDDDGASQHHGKGRGHHKNNHDADEPTHHKQYDDEEGDADEGGHHGGDDHQGGDDMEDGELEGRQDEGDPGDEFHDAADKLEEDDEEPKHKVDRRSPFLSSLLPSSTDTTTVSANTAVDATTTASPYSTDVSATSSASASVTTPESNSGWLSWLGSSDNTPTYSPYSFLAYLNPTDHSMENLTSLFNVFSSPSNNSYLSNAATLMRIVMFFMPGTGIVDQIQFTMALSKIMWEAGTMYYDGYGPTEIAVVALYEMAEAAYLSRRDEESIISQKILTAGQSINIDGMDVPAFLKYTENMKYPDLNAAQEEKLRNDIDNLVTMTYPTLSPELRTSFETGLVNSVKFLALFPAQGNLKVENQEVNFADVYINMHSAYEDSTMEKIKKSILSAMDAIKSAIHN